MDKQIQDVIKVTHIARTRPEQHLVSYEPWLKSQEASAVLPQGAHPHRYAPEDARESGIRIHTCKFTESMHRRSGQLQHAESRWLTARRPVVELQESFVMRL